jgi:MFS family permease
MVITASFYKKTEGVSRIGFWIMTVGVAQILGGVISYLAQTFPVRMTSWRLMFLTIGIANILFSWLVFRMPVTLTDCRWLSEAEKLFVLKRLEDDNAGVGIKVLRKRSVIEVSLDAQTWLLFILQLTVCIPAGVIIYFSAEIIKSYGFSSANAALPNMPAGVLSIFATLLATLVVSSGAIPRWLTLVFCTMTVFFGILVSIFLDGKNKIGMVVGISLVNTVGFPRSLSSFNARQTPGGYALILATVSANYRGYTRKVGVHNSRAQC